MYNDSFNFSSPRESLREKVRSSMCCFGLAVAAAQIGDGDGFEPLEEAKSSRSPHIKEKCRNLTAWIWKGGHKHHGSSDFSYDPMSYALNFEDESSRADEFPFVKFSSRLPSTPERSPEIKDLGETPVLVRREVYAYS